MLSIRLYGFVACCLMTNLAYAISDEQIFDNAKQFTIKIKTTISRPYIQDEKGSYEGTGFLVDRKRGLLVSNAHVVGRSPSIIKGSFYNEDEVRLEKVYIDTQMDIAILKIPTASIPEGAIQADLDCESTIKPGYTVGAYGHPWGLNYTATRGIVSGTPYLVREKWLQIDAPINSGNSGGPLLSMKTGKVIGINSAKINSEKTEGLNFALPIKYTCKILSMLKKGSNPTSHNFPVIFYKKKGSINNHLTIAKVNPYPKNTFKENDVIKGLEGSRIEIENPMDLLHELRDKEGEVKLRVERDGQMHVVNMALVRESSVLGQKAIYIDGMTISPVFVKDADFYGMDYVWLVHDVESGTDAEQESISLRGIVTHINKVPLTSFKKTLELLKQQPMTIQIQYRGSKQFYDYYQYTLPANSVKELEI